MAASLQQLQDFLQGTLLSVQQQQLCTDCSLQDVVLRCIHTLSHKDLITAADGHAPTLQVTRLGRAAYKGESRPGAPRCSGPEEGRAVTSSYHQ